VDGGIDRQTIRSLWEAGANTFVAGNAIFGAKNPKAEIKELRSRCTVQV
jgi:ribulose-phosphate 3-epimerase